ncbi:K02A2.6-like, partial [Cordylochernes scorpioides]
MFPHVTQRSVTSAARIQPPETFDFSTPNEWPKWRKRFERYLVVSGMKKKEEADKIDLFMYLMGDRADDIFRTFKFEKEEEATKIDSVLKAFDSHFCVRKNIIYERAKFNSRIQEDREPVDEFITSLYKLADSCEFEGLHEQLIRDRIVVGVRDKALSERMQLDSELTLEKAVKMVRQQEAVRQQQVDLQRPSTSQKVNQVKFNSKKQSPKQQQQPSRKKEKSAKTRSRCPKCGGFNHREGQACRAEGQRCNLCSKTGHFANCCPDKQAKTAEVKAVSELDEEIGFLLEVSAVEDSSNLDDDEGECRRRWTAEIQVNGKKVKFKLDSQADVTCVPLSLFKKIMGQQRLVESDINLRAAEFSELQTVGMFISTLRNGNYEIKEKIYVIRRLSEPLLSRRACELLNLARRIEVVATRINPIKEFPEVFEGLGQIGNPYEIKLKPGAKPYAVHTPRRVPIPLMEKLKTRLDIPGKELLDADALSRQPLLTTEGGENERPTSAHINAVLLCITDKDEMLTKIFEAQQEDTTLKAVVNYLEQGWPDKKKMSQALLSYWHVKDELGVQNGLLMRGCRLVIPASMKLEILDKLHTGHFGITKTRLRARETVWWPGISEEIAETVRKCSVCIQEAVSKHEPLIPTNFPSRPWQKIGMDLFKFENKWYLVVIDYYSRFPEMVQLDRLTASVVVRSCKSIFARHGIPETVVSDNGTQFGAAREFENFARQYGFTHVTSSPRFPQSNGMAEAGVKIAKMILKKNQDPSLGLLEYRSTPLENGYSPAELLMGRKLRTTLPIAPENLNPKLVDSQTLKRKEGRRRKDTKSRYDRRCGATDMEELSEGDTVWITDMRTWGIVKQKASTPRSYMVDTPVGTLRRNRSHLRKGYAVQYPADPSTPTFSGEELVENEKTPVVDYPSNDSEDGQIRTRSGRIVKPGRPTVQRVSHSKEALRGVEHATFGVRSGILISGLTGSIWWRVGVEALGEPDSCHLVCMPVETRGQKMASEELLKQFIGLMRQEREQEKEEEERRREQEKEEKLKRREEKEEKLKREKEEEERRREQEKEEKLKRREEKEEKWAKMLSGIRVELKGELAALDSKMGEINIALESEVDERRGEFKRLEDELARLKSNGGFVAGTASAVLKITPPTFDGQSSFGNYMRQFEAVSLNNGWGEAERAIDLIVALRGPALDLLQTIPEQDQRSYVSLTSALELRFGDQHSRHVFQSQLKLRRQKMGESLQEFEADLKRLCLMAYPSAPIDFIDQWVAQTFIEGIRNVEVQKTLRLTSFNTSREALIRALEIDAAFKISDSGPPRVRKSELTEEDGAVGGSRDSGIEEIIKRLDKLEEAVKHRRRPVGPCFRCGKMGHLKGQCTSRMRRAWDTLMIEIIVNSKKIKATVDTGAMVSLIRKDALRTAPRPLHRKMMLRTVTGDTAPIEGELDVDIRLGGTRFDHRVLVADIEDEFILGMDIIREHGFTFDPTQGILRLGDESFVLSTEGEKCEGVRLFACENGCVSGNCEGVIMTVAEAPLGSGVGLIEPTCDARQNLLVARAIVKTADKKVPVRLANVFPSGISIRKGDFLAVCSPISRIATTEGTNCQRRVNRVGQTKLEIDLKDLTEDEARMARVFIKKNQDAFSTGNGKLGRTDLVQHKIYTGNARPVRQPPRRVPMAKRDEVVGLLHKLKQDGVIEESNSPWSSPVVLVTKKDGSTRFCVDYRKLNEVTKKDSYPLPRIDDTLTTLAGSSWFSTLDLKSGNWQVGVHPADREKTAFSTGNGLYQFTVMPFGLCNAPATFERLMELVLRGLTWKTCLVYLDDVMVMGRTFGEHLKNLQEIFNRFKAANLGLNPRKCQLFQKKVEFLGHTVSAKGIQTSESKILAIRDWPKPKDKHELRSFLGLCTYYRRFVEGFADIAAPLHRLTEAKSTFHWNQDCEDAFVTLKGGLCSSPVLVYPQPGMRFVLDTDASNSGIGAVLSQVQDGEERVIEYYSKILTKPERNYCATRRELLAIVRSVEHFHRYLYGQDFLVWTDHAALTWLLQMKNPEGQVARWLEKLQQYHFQIRHRPGKRHHNADALSRRPCGSCKHCEKIDKNESEATSRGTTVVPSDEWTPASCRASQQQDLNIGPILELKENGNLRPSWEIISDKSPALKALWAQWDSLRVENGLLKRVWESADGRSTKMQLVVPEVKIPCVLREVHSGASGSHFGVTKTLRKVRERFYWVYCREDVENWCRRCTTCAASKGPQTRSRGKMREYNVGAPFERIAIDVAGPLPVTEDGNKYLLVAMDYFTKWPEVYAIPNQKAATVARVLVDNLICRFGVPLELHSDQGRNFESEIFRELCQVLGIWKTRTTPLHPQSDGMVERFNKTMVEHLSKVVEQNQRDWDRRLPLFLMAYRAAIHETTGQTPAKVMFGRELRLPCDLEFGTPGGPPVEVTSYVGELRGVLSETHKLVREKIQLASHRMKTHYDLKANHEGFKENDLVWMFNPKRKRGLSPKLTPMWEGPYKVVKRINDLVYRIQRSSKAKPRVVHLSRLALFQGEQS